MCHKDIQIVPVTHSALAALAALEQQCFRGECWSERMLSEMLENPAAVMLRMTAAQPDGSARTVGWGGIWCVMEQAEIASLCVAPDCQRQGLGAYLLHTLLQTAKKRGAASVFLEVRASNTAARHLYEKTGFQIIGARRRYYRAPTEDALIMELPF